MLTDRFLVINNPEDFADFSAAINNLKGLSLNQ